MTEETKHMIANAVPPTLPTKGPVFQTLQAGRGVAALMVVVYHTEGLFSLPKYWGVAKPYFYFGSSGVDFFFVLSGIVILHAHRRDIGQPSRLRNYAIKRFQRIYPIYWVVLFLLLPLYFLMPGLGSGFERGPRSILDAFILLPIFRIDTIIPVAWTLTHEIMFYFVFALLIWNKRGGLALMSLWMLGAIACTLLTPGHPILQAYWSPLHLLFGFGLMVRWVWMRLSSKGTALAVTGLVGFAACAIVEDMTRPTSWSLPLAYGLFAAVGSLGLMLIEKRKSLNLPRFLLLLGDASYSIYLVHYAMLSAAVKVCYRVWLSHPVNMMMMFVALVMVASAGGIGVHLLIERPLLCWITGRSRLPKSSQAAS